MGSPAFEHRVALAYIVNFTGFSGHWGMYGTSLALALGLAERGYDCETLNVDEVDAAWRTLSQYQDFVKAPPELQALFEPLLKADIVVVNGEGTLHGNRPSSHNLLKLVIWITRELRKPIYVVNCGYFPDHGETAGDYESRRLYSQFATALQSNPRSGMVVRDRQSFANARTEIAKVESGGDLLPLLLDASSRWPLRHQSSSSRIVISGAAGMSPNGTRNIARRIAKQFGPQTPVLYLSGGDTKFVDYDRTVFEQFASALPQAEFLATSSFAEFRDVIGNAELLISGRFHYLIAAIALATPVVGWASNTPKNELLFNAIGRVGEVVRVRACQEGRSAMRLALRRPVQALYRARLAMLLDARRNLVAIPCGGVSRRTDLISRLAPRLGFPITAIKSLMS